MSSRYFTHAIKREDLGADRISGAIKTEALLYASAHMIWSGASVNPTGDLEFQGANTVDVPGSGDWIDIGTPTTIVSAATGNEINEIGPFAFRWIRAQFDRTAGAGGTVDIYIQVKGQ